MRYAVLGTGVVGRTLADELVKLGHEVRMGSRDPDSPAAGEWAEAAGPVASHGTFADAAEFGEAVISAVGGQVALAALRSVGEEPLAGKLLIDVSNPIAFEDGRLRLSPVESDSVGEQIQRAFPRTQVVKSLNTVNCTVMVSPAKVPGGHQVFVSGDDERAKERTRRLLGEFGWPADRVIDLGGIETARAVEMMLPLWFTLFQKFGHPEFNFEVRKAHRPASGGQVDRTP
ncbi:NADPH-dependent F420 reductase [Streptomyces sp. NPDC057445]|uniref:NADPH-dependent F420 reductase n=1 Tax=Streptomyces sp. NPDC057445 TaxID=3346136 RepID=UPI0036CB2C3B